LADKTASEILFDTIKDFEITDFKFQTENLFQNGGAQ